MCLERTVRNPSTSVLERWPNSVSGRRLGGDLKWRFGLLTGGGRLEPCCCEGTGGAGNVEQWWSGKV